MNHFEFMVLVWAIPLGLVLVEIATSISRAIKMRREITVGFLTPVAALTLVLNTAVILFNIWEAQPYIQISPALIAASLVTAIAYYISASFLVPPEPETGMDLDEWFMENRRISIGLTILMTIISDLAFFTKGAEFSVINILSGLLTLSVVFSPFIVSVFAKSKRTALIGLVIGSSVFALLLFIV